MSADPGNTFLTVQTNKCRKQRDAKGSRDKSRSCPAMQAFPDVGSMLHTKDGVQGLPAQQTRQMDVAVKEQGCRCDLRCGCTAIATRLSIMDGNDGHATTNCGTTSVQDPPVSWQRWFSSSALPVHRNGLHQSSRKVLGKVEKESLQHLFCKHMVKEDARDPLTELLVNSRLTTVPACRLVQQSLRRRLSPWAHLLLQPAPIPV